MEQLTPRRRALLGLLPIAIGIFGLLGRWNPGLSSAGLLGAAAAVTGTVPLGYAYDAPLLYGAADGGALTLDEGSPSTRFVVSLPKLPGERLAS